MEMSELAVVENAQQQLLSNGSWSVDRAHSAIGFRGKHMVTRPAKGLDVAAVRVA
jgi:polyisoprenoid-binding protein YceI